MNKNEYIINIEGVIGYPDIMTILYGEKTFSYNDVLLHINKIKKNKKIDTIILAINSLGGYVNIGDKIYNELNKLKSEGYTFLSYNTGDVMSIATKLFLLPDEENRIFYEEKGQFLIHNPWTGVQGDADTLLEVSEDLRKTENELAVFYTVNTSLDIETALKFMKEDQALTSDIIEEFNIAKVIKRQEVKAFAMLNQKINEQEMNKENVKEEISKFEKLILGFKKTFGILNIVIVDNTGNELDIPEISDISELTEGLKVTIGGSPAEDNDYVITSINKTITVENGVITKIDETEAPAEDETSTEEQTTDETDLSLEIENLKAQLLEKENEISNSKIELEDVKNQLVEKSSKLDEAILNFKEIEKSYNEIKNLSSNFNVDTTTTIVDKENKNERTFTWKK